MIYIVYLTPHAYIALAKSGMVAMQAFRHCVLPTRSPADIFLADTVSQQWPNAAVRLISQLSPQVRHDAQELLQQLEATGNVFRRAWPEISGPIADERTWVRHAQDKSPVTPDFIFTTPDLADGNRCTSVEKLLDPEWSQQHLASGAMISLQDAKSHKRILQRLLLGMDWCLAELPYVAGGSDDEIVVFKWLLDSSVVNGTQATLVELVSQSNPDNVNQLKNIRQELQANAGRHRHLRVNVHLLENLLDRHFTVGRNRQIAGGECVRTPSVSVSAQHVGTARRGPEIKSSWSLKNNADRRAHWQQIQSQLDSRHPELVLR